MHFEGILYAWVIILVSVFNQVSLLAQERNLLKVDNTAMIRNRYNQNLM